MPAFNLTTDGAEVEDVSITQTGDTITVGGTYVLSIENTGVLPMLLTATVELEELEVTGVTALEDESETVTGTDEIEFDFSFTQNASQYSSTAESICNAGGQLDAEGSGMIRGIVAATEFDESVRTTLPSARCNLGTGNGDGGDTDPTEPNPVPEPDPGEDDNGDGGDGGDTEPVPEPPDDRDLQVINKDAQEGGYEDPYVNTTQTYVAQENGERIEDYPTGEFLWIWQFDNERTKRTDTAQEILGAPAQVDYNWDSTGDKVIAVTVIDNETNQEVFEITKTETVVENEGGGGLFTQDQGGIGESDLPSMSEAADQKEREY